jgi:uncharacterized membrane protein
MLLFHADATTGFSIFGYDLPRLHAVINDLPILLVAAVAFELAWLVTRRDSFRAAGYWTLILGTVGAGLAVLSGLGAEDHIAHGEAVHRIIEEHEEFAYWTLGIFAVVTLWRIVRERSMKQGERIAALVLALAGTGMLVATGREGGEMVFDHAAGVPTEQLEAEIKDRAAGHQHDEDETDHEATQPGDSAKAQTQ